jgi:GT2 family glycosyltransferase
MIEIVLTVHDAHDALRDCLRSLGRTVRAEAPLRLIDDASSDPRVEPLLRAFAEGRPGTRLDLHRERRGYTRRANEGLSESPHDVILLNSDTVLTSGWLERLEACALSDPRIGTICPFSNNAILCSFPRFCEENPVPADPELVARVFAETGAPDYPELPTAMGFCFFLRREMLDEVGLFDTERFGEGYGEENDLCMRATEAGWRHVLCDDAYVAHLGSRSFGERTAELLEAHLPKLLERHPAYFLLVRRFIRADPLRARRDELLAALRRVSAEWEDARR